MEKDIIKDHEFLTFNLDKATFVFSTAEENHNFNISSKEGIENIKKVKEHFNLKEIGFLNQIHSDLIYSFDGEVHQGDGLITSRKNVAVGIFTADCVPILFYDKVQEVVAAVHSGWKGTYLEISSKAIDKLRQEYNCKPKDISVYIGPHIKKCCYEVGQEVVEKFSSKDIYKELKIIENNKLSLEDCIIKQLENKGVLLENIHNLGYCTYCNEELKLYSYRKQKEASGRMFSFVFLR